MSYKRLLRAAMKTILRPRQIFLISFFTLCSFLLTWLSGLAAFPYTHPLRQATIQPPTPSPTYDPLAIPTLPAHPTQFELGKNLYYYHCMPCHGDLGQGLTDAWRMVWEEDHRNCWGRGCHGGRPQDEGFPIPTIVPAVIAPDDLLDKYPDLESLVRYLHDTHPPQKPGQLKEDEYRALAVFLWVSNKRPLPAQGASFPAVQPSPAHTDIPPPPSPTSTHPATPTASPQPVVASPPLPPHDPGPNSGYARVPVLVLYFAAFLLSMLIVLIILKILHRLDRP